MVAGACRAGSVVWHRGQHSRVLPFLPVMLTRAKRLLVANHGKIRWLLPNRYFAFSVLGGKIYLNPKESMMMLERAFGLYEPEKFQAIQSILRPGGVFVDVGGNKGDFALLAASIVGEEGKVFCIEPEPKNAEWIRRSVQLNGYKNVTVCETALGDKDGTAILHLGVKSGFHTLLPGLPDRDTGSIEIKAHRLDTLLRTEPRVDAVKIDVEGLELQVLRGAMGTLKANPHIVLLMDIHPQLGVDRGEVIVFLETLGFTCRPMHSENEILARRQLC